MTAEVKSTKAEEPSSYASVWTPPSTLRTRTTSSMRGNKTRRQKHHKQTRTGCGGKEASVWVRRAAYTPRSPVPVAVGRTVRRFNPCSWPSSCVVQSIPLRSSTTHKPVSSAVVVLKLLHDVFQCGIRAPKQADSRCYRWAKLEASPPALRKAVEERGGFTIPESWFHHSCLEPSILEIYHVYGYWICC